jgi:hypothetical protein
MSFYTPADRDKTRYVLSEHDFRPNEPRLIGVA